MKEPPAPAMERGEKLHLVMEDAIRNGPQSLPKTLQSFAPRVDELRAQSGIEVEQMWAFDSDWQPCDAKDYDRVWLRMKLDFFGFIKPTHAHVVDWKSGRIYPDHMDGMLLYALGVFLRHPKVRKTTVSLEYLDQKEGNDEDIPRRNMDAIRSTFDKRVIPLMTDDEFKPSPGRHCGWCSFNPSRGGTCDAARA